MKKLINLIAVIVAVSAYSQGTIGTVNFNNISRPWLNAPVIYGYTEWGEPGPVPYGIKPDPLGMSYTVGGYVYGGQYAQSALYGGVAGTAEADLQILLPASGFRSGYYAGGVGSDQITTCGIPGTYGGDPGVVQVRAWDAGELLTDNTYQGAVAASANHGVYYGVSKVMIITELGGTPNTPEATYIPPPNLPLGTVVIPMNPSGTFVVPEPSIIGLGILGAIAGWMVFRRRD